MSFFDVAGSQSLDRSQWENEWFETWFNSGLYSSLYKHRCREEADLMVDLIVRSTEVMPGSSVLDICCGNGRHSAAFARRGYAVTGLDLSTALLREAAEQPEAAGIRFVQGDIRDGLPEGPFDLAVNLFTSFGYFDTDEEHAEVFCHVRHSLREGGIFFFDFLNAVYARRTLVPLDTSNVGGATITQERVADDLFVRKVITVETNDGKKNEYHERVRLFDLNDIAGMMKSARLELTAVYGDYHGGAYTHHSPRLIAVAQAL